ncbi:hypothetical protein DBV15_04366 [Temnothorax longispinosus]|uniref:Uncharacterized protein n=1 Tax=Temnothorax longispinosus TaxID=300112 RepID=A0A4S2KFC5_9HYME|nr:hypothetical protein DBV15_04366 [Temnothorax longispinosus]
MSKCSRISNSRLCDTGLVSLMEASKRCRNTCKDSGIFFNIIFRADSPVHVVALMSAPAQISASTHRDCSFSAGVKPVRSTAFTKAPRFNNNCTNSADESVLITAKCRGVLCSLSTAFTLGALADSSSTHGIDCTKQATCNGVWPK